jgi:hypothetical protein
LARARLKVTGDMEDPRPPMPARGLFHVGYPAVLDVQGIVAARRVVDVLGEANARDLLGILELPEDHRTDLIAHMCLHDEGHIFNVLTDIDRLRLIGGLRRVLSTNA